MIDRSVHQTIIIESIVFCQKAVVWPVLAVKNIFVWPVVWSIHSAQRQHHLSYEVVAVWAILRQNQGFGNFLVAGFVAV